MKAIIIIAILQQYLDMKNIQPTHTVSPILNTVFWIFNFLYLLADKKIL
jgi:hypothetical protein